MPESAQPMSREAIEKLASERRLRVRYASDLPALCQKTDAEIHDIWLRGKIRDVSVSGARLLLNRPFATNSLIVVEPFQNKDLPARNFEARVIYASRLPQSGWVMGCEFTDPLSESELRALVGD